MNEFDSEYARFGHVYGDQVESIVSEFVELLDPGLPVLDVGAGQGRNTLFLAKKGFAVTALEPASVGAAQIQRRAAERGLEIEILDQGYVSYDPHERRFGGILLLGLLQVLSWPAIADLMRRCGEWAAPRCVLFVTAFTTDDPKYPQHARTWKAIGHNSFLSQAGVVRTYLRPGELDAVCGAWRSFHSFEGLGPEHRHGSGPAERHAIAEGVYVREFNADSQGPDAENVSQ